MSNSQSAGSSNADSTDHAIDWNILDDVYERAKTDCHPAVKPGELGRQLKYQRTVLNHFSAAVLSAFPSKSDAIRKQLIKVAPFHRAYKHRKKSGRELAAIAQSLIKQHSLSVLYFQLAADAYENEADIKGIVETCEGVMNIANDDHSGFDRVTVQSRILPIFYHFRVKIEHLPIFATPDIVVADVLCLRAAAVAQIKFQLFEDAEQNCKTGLRIMDSMFPGTALRQRVYGTLLFNLASAIGNAAYFDNDAKRLELATRVAWKAISCYKITDDFESAEIRKHSIEFAVDMIRLMQVKLDKLRENSLTDGK